MCAALLFAADFSLEAGVLCSRLGGHAHLPAARSPPLPRVRVRTLPDKRQFRVNANHKLIDAWLLALCTACGKPIGTHGPRTDERALVRSELLDRLVAHDPGLAASCSRTRSCGAESHRPRLDDAWRLDTGGSDHLDREVIDVSVRFAVRILSGPVRLIAEGAVLHGPRSRD